MSSSAPGVPVQGAAIRSKVALLVVMAALVVGVAGCAATAAVETTMAAAVAATGPSSETAFGVAIDSALAVNPDLVDPQVSRAIAIWADASTVDLRVQVMAESYCQWFGVGGVVDGGALRWHGEPLQSCDG